jgi:hypothetical protein
MNGISSSRKAFRGLPALADSRLAISSACFLDCVRELQQRQRALPGGGGRPSVERPARSRHFVEHKGADPDYQLAKAVASFANQLGGWVLVNVGQGKDPRPLGALPGWITKAASPIDAVRDRLDGRVHPMPPFEARRMELEDGWLLVLACLRIG